jgi:hypothetical protein
MCKGWIALLVMMPCLFAHGDENNCKEVSGGVVTNFLTESGTVNFANESGKQFIYTTIGTATGDLAGALGVYIFSITPGANGVVAKVHHHWVTDAGDTIYLQDATANAFQVGPYSGVYAVADNSYTVNIIGGTGPLCRRDRAIEHHRCARYEPREGCASLSGDDLLRAT